MKKPFESSPGLARTLGCLVFLPVLAVFGCGLGSEEGTIKAPRRGEMLPGAPAAGPPPTPPAGTAAATNKKKTPRRRGEPELKIMTLGGKRM
jgi:hypothetical protein